MDPLLGLGGPQRPPSHTAATRPQLTRQPSLLPAFEPVSSSPPRSNIQKRKFEDTVASTRKYPTPLPSSSTAIASSSPSRRPAFPRTTSTCSERAPLSNVEAVHVPVSGETIYLGRSSASSHFQLPYNRLISRRHVSARYEARSSSNASPQLVIECLGWNGCKVHNAGRVHELGKGQSYVSTQPFSEIILDVQDSRVFLSWPLADDMDGFHGEDWARDSSPDETIPAPQRAMLFCSSPPPLHIQSPVSPSPAGHLSRNLAASMYGDENADPAKMPAVQVYEDPESDHADEPAPGSPSASMHTTFHQTSRAKRSDQETSQESLRSASECPEEPENEIENEENDPVVHSFGPFGANILSRMHSFSANDLRSPEPQVKRRKILQDAGESPQRTSSHISPHKSPKSQRPPLLISPIKNHVINQLAFSRVHAIPLSSIHGNLPTELKTANSPTSDDNEVLTHADLKQILDDIPCVGEIRREGKDAAGKPLENEFYYMPDNDDNLMRRDAVLGGMGGTGLRAVRKNHKQYFWKRPRH